MLYISRLFSFFLIFLLADISISHAISTNPECYKSSDLKITMENLRLNENNQYLFKKPNSKQFKKWGPKLGKCQYKSMTDINSPLYTTFDDGDERGVILNGFREGVWTIYFENTDLKKYTGKYINSQKDGKWIEFDELGQVLTKLSMKWVK